MTNEKSVLTAKGKKIMGQSKPEWMPDEEWAAYVQADEKRIATGDLTMAEHGEKLNAAFARLGEAIKSNLAFILIMVAVIWVIILALAATGVIV